MTDTNEDFPAERERYEAPELEELGTFAELTQGAFAGTQDSNDSGSR